MTFTVTTCRSCPAQIIWAGTTKDKPMPVDAAPHPDGNVRLTDRGTRAPLAEIVPPGQAALSGPEELRRSHFTTCPQADSWRTR